MKNDQTIKEVVATLFQNYIDLTEKVNQKKFQLIRAEANFKIAEIKRDNEKIKKLGKKIKSLEKSYYKLADSNHWTDNILKPIGEHIKTELNGFSVETVGPFGLSCNVSLWIFKTEQAAKDRDINNMFSLSVNPSWDYSTDGKQQEIGIHFTIKDYSKKIHDYPENSMGAQNGGNFANHDIMDWTLGQLVEHLKNKEGEEE